MSENLNQIRYLATNYSRLQGLRSVPVGIFVAAAGIWVNLPAGQDGDLAVPLLMILLFALAYFLVDRYYARAFGQVHPTGRERNREIVVSLLMGVLTFFTFIFDSKGILPISTFGLFFALAIFIGFSRPFGKLDFQGTPEAFLTPILIGTAALLPLFGISWWQLLGIQTSQAGMLLLIGVLMIISGIVSHLRFTRLLAHLGEADNA